MSVTSDTADFRAAEQRVLDAAKSCTERWGTERVTIDDICQEAGISRATIYRMFPGGKDVLFDALRVRELEVFFQGLTADTQGVTDLEELFVALITSAGRRLHADTHLASMLAAEPGATVTDLTVDGLPRIIRVATVFLAPMVEPYLSRADATRVVEVLARLVISFFLAPSHLVDITDEDSVRSFVHSFMVPAVKIVDSKVPQVQIQGEIK